MKDVESQMIHIPSFKIIGILVLEKKIFPLLFLHMGHLGHVIWTIYTIFNPHSQIVRELHIKFGFD